MGNHSNFKEQPLRIPSIHSLREEKEMTPEACREHWSALGTVCHE